MKKDQSHSGNTSPATELLEERRLLSGVVMQPMLTLTPSTTSYVSGFTPSQISNAYGFNQLSGNGAGQTIAIVDAYRDPNAAADLHVFDQQFGLSDPSLSIVNQYGGSVSSVPTNAGWSTETALDLEWAHAMAPQAKILLVEANSANLGDLLKAVDYARHAAGVSVVSMSWGASEFSSQQYYDSYFTTPTGHNGITFVAASGDSGSAYGPSWPSTSRNVLAVGGTVLRLSSTGGYGYETGWNYSTGGVSRYVSEPSYQLKAQQTGARTSPDVGYNATGFAIYSSVPDNGYVGWSTVGGTSAGAPQWAALIAIANQLRVAAGKGTLNGTTGTLPTLYSLYSPYGTTGYSTYTSAFNDITSGATSSFISAHTGYDEVVGLGTPKAVRVVSALQGAGTTTTTTAVSYNALSGNTVTTAAVHQPAAAPSAPAGQEANAQAPTTFVAAGLLDQGMHATTAPGQGEILLQQGETVGATSAASWFAADRPSDGAGSAISSADPLQNAATGVTPAVATAIFSDMPVATSATEAMAQAVGPQTHVNALAAVASDGIAGLAHESAALGAAISSQVASGQGGATRMTALAVTADGILVAAWAAHVFNRQRTAASAYALSADRMVRPFGEED